MPIIGPTNPSLFELRIEEDADGGASSRRPAVALVALALLTAVTVGIGSSPRALPPGDGVAEPMAGLTVEPGSIDLGQAAPGRKPGGRLRLRNRFASPAELDRVETSCPCVAVSPAMVRIGPGEVAEVDVTFDPAEEPGFRGTLVVDLTGHDRMGSILFRSSARLAVIDPSPSRSGGETHP